MWKPFLGACLLTAALLQPHAPVKSIVGGMALAGLVLWARSLATRHRSRDEVRGKSNHRRNRETDS